MRRLWSRVAALQTRQVAVPADRYELGVAARRAMSLAGALAAFALGLSADDVHVLRLPGYLVGCAAAIVLIAIGPLWLGRSFALAHRDDDAARFAARAAQARRLGALTFLVTLVLFLIWLVVFSSGVPPWATAR